MASFTFNAAKKALADGELDWENDDIYIALYTAAAAPDIDNDAFRSDLSNEFSGGSYPAGGIALTNKSSTQDDTNDRAILDADDVQFTGLTGTFRYGIVYRYTGTPASERLLRCIDLENGDVTLTNGTYDIPWSAGGVLTIN